jgi:DNA-binding CsgD family transcriptional regulator
MTMQKHVTTEGSESGLWRTFFDIDIEDHISSNDFVQIFADMTARYGFQHFGLLRLGGEEDAASFERRLVLHNFPTGFAETYDERYRFTDSDLFKSFYETTTPLVWSDDPDASGAGNGTLFLDQTGYMTALSIPIHTTTGARYVLLFLGDDEATDELLSRACLEGNWAFQSFQKQILEKEVRSGLTARETEILQWISYGKTASEIAIIASVSEHTVNSHTASILKKLGAVNRTQMVATAIRNRIIT